MANARRSALPPPERDDPALLRELREVAGLAERLEMAVDIDGLDVQSILARDAGLSMQFDPSDVTFLNSLAADSGAATPYRSGAPPTDHAAALRTVAALLARYNAGEFMPPNSYFGIPDPEA